MRREDQSHPPSVKYLRIAMATTTGIAIICSLVFAAMDRPLMIVVICSCSIPALGVLAILLARKEPSPFVDDSAHRRHRIGLIVAGTGVLAAAAGLITLLLDLGVLPPLLLVLGAGAVGGGALIAKQAREEISSAPSSDSKT